MATRAIGYKFVPTKDGKGWYANLVEIVVDDDPRKAWYTCHSNTRGRIAWDEGFRIIVERDDGSWIGALDFDRDIRPLTLVGGLS
jgi:hypothetical protein